MNQDITPGRYVVAVSGGVDSMVMLNMLAKLPRLELVVSHFNHGIRPDSGEDEELVRNTAKSWGLPLEVGYGHLGSRASEQKARDARYKFLFGVMKDHRAKAVITAHHQNDLIETALINILRGTGRRGLSSMRANQKIIRPLLSVPKKELIAYAKAHRLKWREDPTNAGDDYLRNYIRRHILPKLTASQKTELLQSIHKLEKLNPVLDEEIAKLSQSIGQDGKINRQKFINLPSEIANEVVIYQLRSLGSNNFDAKTVNRLNLAIKTARAGTVHPVNSGLTLKIEAKSAYLLTDAN